MTSRRPSKPHPVDFADAAIVANAIRFEIALFVNYRYEKASAATLPEAETAAAALLGQYPGHARRPMIYAIDDRGRQTLVTATNRAIAKTLTPPTA
jgi:hypothetical protein